MSDKTTKGHPLFELTRARLLEFIRDPSALFWVFIFPVLLAIVLGIAFREQGSEVIHVAVTGSASESLMEKLDGYGAGEPRILSLKKMAKRDALDFLRTAKVDLVVMADSTTNDKPSLIYRYDPTRPGADAVRLATDDLIQKSFGRSSVVEVKEEKVEERGGRYIDFLIPGLIGLNIMGSCMWGMGYAIVDCRRRKLLKRFAVTPMRRSHFLLAFILSRLIFLISEVALLSVFGWLVFDVGVRGSIVSFGLISLGGMTAFSGLALLVASRTASTETASGWMNFVQLPMWLLAGSFFSYNRFPEFLHPFIKILPLTALNDASRAIVNEGSSLLACLPQLGILICWGLLSFVLALKIFRWQ